MKNKYIAMLMTSCLLGSGSVYSATIYDKNNTQINFSGKIDGRRLLSKDSKDRTSVKLAIKGSTKINENSSGYGTIEEKFNANAPNGNSNKTDLAYVGLKNDDYGSIDYGRNRGILRDVSYLTDQAPIFGGSYTYSDNFMANKSNSLLTYRKMLSNGIGVGIQYQGKNESKDIIKDNDEGYGISVSYKLTDLGLTGIAAYSNSKLTKSQRQILADNKKRATAWTAGVKYEYDNLYLAATYAETRYMTKLNEAEDSQRKESFSPETKNLEFAIQYRFSTNIIPTIEYVQSNAINTTDGNFPLYKYVVLGVEFMPVSNINIYAAYNLSLLDKNNSTIKKRSISTSDSYGVGIKYMF